MNGEWISVWDALPILNTRVWASAGPADIGRDCYFGTTNITFKQMLNRYGVLDHNKYCWRYTDTEKPCSPMITHWMHLPDPPKESQHPIFFSLRV